MTDKQVLDDIKYAYRNVQKKLKTQGNRVLLQGKSKSGKYNIEMWVNLETGIIETAYPKF